MEVRLEHMMPAEIEAARDACPTLFIPLGTIEWHGLHSVAALAGARFDDVAAIAEKL
ncbi:MAG: hypothetical protein GXY15_10855 [Candidatus Hydrogenedentes bacterium]|nr:hypothetical protein [Candidatus Hydrogenedentota bacterium]